MAICRVAMLAFMFGDPCSPSRASAYSAQDLIDLTEFCQAYIDEGLTHEPMDDFNLQGFIDWAATAIELAQKRRAA